MIAFARLSLSSSETPEGFSNRSISAFFSASAADCPRMYSEAFSASATAIVFMHSLAEGKSSSEFVDNACSENSKILYHSRLAATLPRQVSQHGAPYRHCRYFGTSTKRHRRLRQQPLHKRRPLYRPPR